MNKPINEIIKVVEKLESDVLLSRLDNDESIAMFKERAHMLLPTLQIAKNDIKNLGYVKTYDKLIEKVVRVVQKLESL